MTALATLISFLRERSLLSAPWLIAMALTAGVTNALILGVLNAGAASAVRGGPLDGFALAFVAVTVAYVVAQRQLFERTSGEVERILHRFRMEQLARVRRTDLDAIERIGSARIYDCLTRQPDILSSAAGSVILGLQSALIVVVTLAYIAWLKPAACVLAVLVLAIGGMFARNRLRRAEAVLRDADRAQGDVFDALTDLIHGLKEVRLHAGRRAALARFIDDVSARLSGLRTAAETRLSESYLLLQATFYYAAAAMVFVLPGLGVTSRADTMQTMTAALFLIGPLTAVAASASAMARARAACEALLDLDRQLTAAADRTPASSRDLGGFAEIELSDVVYQHQEAGQAGFRVGPLTLVLHRRDVLFISGGNGAGKSTLLKLLTSLYRPQAGLIRVDGQPVGGALRDAYQNLFAAVFADFHLFRRLHGLSHVAPEDVERWLERMEIADKVRVEDGQWHTIRLSSGQRRRLALVVAALEDRPIYVFDEWAADQDPSFRQKFYDEILPLLRARDKTIVAVTHDERYLDRATRHLRMDEGRLSEVARD